VFKRCRFWDGDSRAEFTLKCVVNSEHGPLDTRELTISRDKLAPQIRPREKARWRRPKEGYYFSKVGPASICLELGILAGEQVLTLECVPDL
jgi:hypothetical protein